MNPPGSRRQRVLLHAFSTFTLGGPQARFVQLANAFGPEYRHIVAAMDNRFEAGERLEPGVNWQPLKLDVKKGGALANRGAFRAVLQRTRPDLLVSYNWGAIEWSAANVPGVVPQVHVEDGFGPEEATRQLPRRVWMRRILLGWRGVPVVVASRNLERVAKEVWKLSPRRVRFLPNGVEIPSARIVEDLTGAQRPIRIGTVAGLRPEKNIARLIRAFAALRAQRAARLILVGDGPLRADLQALARELNVDRDVEFVGYLADPSLRLRDFDLFVLTSDTEQLPIALLEAMATGMPVVATRVGDVPDVLADVSPQTLCPPDDAAVRDTLTRACEQLHLWPAWAQAGREKVMNAYAKPRMLSDWKQVFDGANFNAA
ncbi:glycosyltransferase family 4 protein [Hydrogenophaga sp. BPS33]|uniref:glycosyltransferase family 4 protein n=1 Tax=Hydrogenophaga sp. BPS33 TaxID=2651974 RepID=UPI00131F8E70|nr:glycosyltransferase family 4 protein [Hydrogenophaga sp. BPS33]QHE85920.1 glycosyltransferase family 4 protein [Hydrogenophaga sp. BPS33]